MEGVVRDLFEYLLLPPDLRAHEFLCSVLEDAMLCWKSATPASARNWSCEAALTAAFQLLIAVDCATKLTVVVLNISGTHVIVPCIGTFFVGLIHCVCVYVFLGHPV